MNDPPANESEWLKELNSSTLFVLLEHDHEGAWCQLFDRYLERLIGLVRSRLSEQIRTKEDPEDIVSSVFRTFYRRVAHARKIDTLEKDFWPLLAAIAIRKCAQRADYYHSQKRDVHREVAANRNAETMDWETAIDRYPTEDEARTLAEFLLDFPNQLSEREKVILQHHLAGETVPEVAASTECSEYAVRLCMKKIEGRLRRMLDKES